MVDLVIADMASGVHGPVDEADVEEVEAQIYKIRPFGSPEQGHKHAAEMREHGAVSSTRPTLTSL